MNAETKNQILLKLISLQELYVAGGSFSCQFLKCDKNAWNQSKISYEVLNISCGKYPCSHGEKDSLHGVNGVSGLALDFCYSLSFHLALIIVNAQYTLHYKTKTTECIRKDKVWYGFL
jgi:hypothetical protein